MRIMISCTIPGQSKLRTLFNNVTPTLAQEEPTIPSTSPLGQDTTHPEEGVKSQFPRPLQQDAWWKDKDGFLATDAWGADNNGVHPTIWLQQSEEQVHLCVYQYRALTLLLLIPTLLNGSNSLDTFTLLKEQLLDEVSLTSQIFEHLLFCFGGRNLVLLHQQELNDWVIRACDCPSD